MDRLKQITFALLTLCCLSGCSTPEKITDSDWEIVDINTPNTIAGTTGSNGGLGVDNWGVDKEEETTRPSINETVEPEEVPVATTSTTKTTSSRYVETDSEPQELTPTRTYVDPGSLTRDEIASLPTDEFKEMFSIENDTYYTDKFGKYIYTKTGQFIWPSVYSIDGAYALYVQKHGTPTLTVETMMSTEYYWLLSDKVITLRQEGYYVYESEAPYTEPTGEWEGDPFYEDFDNVIYKNSDGTYKAYNKLTLQYTD